MITPAMRDAADYMHKLWKYEADGRADDWDIGMTVGDCEDFALTVLWLLHGKSKTRVVKALLTGKARIIRTKTPRDVGHAVLEYGGHYICNRYPTWSDWRAEYKERKPYSRAMIALKLAFGKVL
jgi:hypothetical protein